MRVVPPGARRGTYELTGMYVAAGFDDVWCWHLAERSPEGIAHSYAAATARRARKPFELGIPTRLQERARDPRIGFGCNPQDK